MNVTAVHTGTALPLTSKGLYCHSPRIVRTIFVSYDANPVLLSWFTLVIAPAAFKHSLNEPTICVLPERWISVLVTSSGTMFFSPAVRDASSAVGATICGGAGGGGGGGGGGGAPSTPLGSPFSWPPSWPVSTPFGSAFDCCCTCSRFSIFTGWTMSLTLIFFGTTCWSLGLAPPLGGGGGGGGGGANAMSDVPFGGSSCSIS